MQHRLWLSESDCIVLNNIQMSINQSDSTYGNENQLLPKILLYGSDVFFTSLCVF